MAAGDVAHALRCLLADVAVWENAKMPSRRPSPLLSRLIVAWFVLALGVFSASHRGVSGQLVPVCSSANGFQVVMVLMVPLAPQAAGDLGPVVGASFDAHSDDGSAAGHLKDCPLCAGAALPMPQQPLLAAHAQPLAHALTPVAAAHIAALVGAPLPPRGPPLTA